MNHLRPSTLAAILVCFASLSKAECPVEILPNTTASLEQPGQDPVAVIYAQGIRLYNCTTGSPQYYSGGIVTFTGHPIPANGLFWNGVGIYPGAAGNGDFVVDQYSDAPVAPTTFNLTLDYNTVQFFPSPTGDLDWARWDVYSTPAKYAEDLNIGWGSRVDTVGGIQPSACPLETSSTEERELTVPYTATYYFYPCPTESPTSSSGGAGMTSGLWFIAAVWLTAAMA